MAYKKRAIVASANGDDRLEYWVMYDSETSPGMEAIKKCAPMAWHKLDLEDRTAPDRMEKAACIRYRKVQTQFNKQVDDNAWLRANPQPDGQRYQALCRHLGIVF